MESFIVEFTYKNVQQKNDGKNFMAACRFCLSPSLQLGGRKAIVLCDFQSMKEAFSQDVFIGRPPEGPFYFNDKTIETGAFNGLAWKEQRRSSLHILKDLGFGRSHMEDMLREEISDVLKDLEAHNGRPFEPRIAFATSMSNNIATLVFGSRLKPDNPMRVVFDKVLNESIETGAQVAWQLFFPWIAKLVRPFNLGTEAKLKELVQVMKDAARTEIEEHDRTLNPNNIRSYIDGYLLEIRKRNDDAFCKEVLEDLVRTFFGAGSETVRISMEWLTLAMALYPEVQKKIQSEIAEVIGQERLPFWSDQPKMPYTEATIMELNRWRTIIPLNLLRYTLWDTELNGYFIPKHSIVLSNIWAVHHNPEYWGKDVELFKPERFLSQDGKEVVKSEYYMPFSIGKRACPGELFARTEVFLYFVSLLQKFNVSLPPGSTANTDDVELSIGLSPKRYSVCFNKRS